MSHKPFVNRLAVGRWLLLLPLALVVNGCFWGNEFKTRHLIGHYYLDGIDSQADSWYLHFEDKEWGLADALISSTIAEAGFSKIGLTRSKVKFLIINNLTKMQMFF